MTATTAPPDGRRPDVGIPSNGPSTSGRPLSKAAAMVATSVVCLPFVSGVVLWLLSLGRIDLAQVSEWGLLPALPVTWYLAVSCLVAGAGWAVCTRRVVPTAIYVLALVVVLYGTMTVVADVPHYAWAYKHIGVTRYIELHGNVDPAIDIYQRWPGFFAVTAVFSWLAGRENPVDYAAWAEVFFTGVTAVLVAAVATRLLRDRALGWAAALLFVLTNWVGQSYFAPQAFAFVLVFGLYLLLFDHFVTIRPNWLGRRVFAVAGWVVRRPVVAAPAAGTTPIASPSRRWPRWAVAGLVILGQIIVVVSHQLTPYMFLIGIGVLALLGLVRPWWLVVTLGVLTLAYLVPNFSFIHERYGLLTGFDPAVIARLETSLPLDPVPGKKFHALAGAALAFSVWTIAAIGAVRWLRRPGEQGWAIVTGVLTLSGAGLVIGQNYGGEGVLRLFLFSLPWAVVLVVRALPIRQGLRRVAAVAGLLSLVTALFLPAYFGQEEINVHLPDEVAAAEYLYTRGEPGYAIVTATPAFPGRVGPSYENYDNAESLIALPQLQHHQLGNADIASVADYMGSLGGRGYVVFSTTQQEYAEIFRLTPPGALPRLEAAMLASGKFKIWHQTPNTRVYEIRQPAA